MNDKYLVFHIEGGLGKNIASTAILKSLKQKYPDRKIVVVASWPEVFLNNCDVYRVYKINNTPYFYDNYIKNKDTIVLRKEAYYENNHIMRKTSLIKTMFDMYDVEYTDDVRPTLPLNMIQRSHISLWKRDKPVLLLHTNGGPFDHKQPHGYSWTRDMPIYLSSSIANSFKDGYHIIQVCKPDSMVIPGVEVINKPMTSYQLFALLVSSSKRLLIDSCLQHAAAAYERSSTVFWIGTRPEMFGYDLHTNITANSPSSTVKNIDSYMFDYEFSGLPHQCPYGDERDIFNVEEIIENLKNDQ